MTPPVAIVIVLLAGLGGFGLVRLGRRLRTETDALLSAFARTEPMLAPIVAAVRSERDALARRLDGYRGDSEPSGPRR